MDEKTAKRRRILKVLLIHVGAAALFALWLFLTGCPIHRLTGLPCPGCGMSRALFSLAKLDFAGAWYYHPLVFFLPLPLLYLIHRKAWKLPGGKRAAIAVAAAIGIALLAVYVIRALTPGSFVYTEIHSSVFAAKS